MPANAHTFELIPARNALDLANSLTKGDLEFLIFQTRSRIAREVKNAKRSERQALTGRNANQDKLDRARDLEKRLVTALGYDPERKQRHAR